MILIGIYRILSLRMYTTKNVYMGMATDVRIYLEVLAHEAATVPGVISKSLNSV